MATSSGRVDEFVKDYLIYRGLSTTLKTLELELKNEKEKGFRVDKIVDQLHTYVATYDLPNLRDYWNFLNARLFSRLEQRYMTSVRKLEVGLLKYYLVNASQNNKQEKILDFFDRMTELLQTHGEFKEWFAFPFVRSPKDNIHFATYFTQQWQDTFFLSLHNFLSVVLQAMPPILISFESELRQLKELQTENERLKAQLQSLGEKPDTGLQMTGRDGRSSETSHMDLVYDFSALGEETAIQEPASKSPRKFPFSSSPLSIGKKVDKNSQPAKKKDEPVKMSSTPTKDSKAAVAKSGSRLLPAVINRQKKIVKPGSSSSIQSQALEPPASQIVEAGTASTNQNTGDGPTANHKLKKLEDARISRKELLESNTDKQKSKEDKKTVEVKQEPGGAYSRSVSEIASSATGPAPTSPQGTRQPPTKGISHPVKTSAVASEGTPATVAMETVMSDKDRELQTFPPSPAKQQTAQADSQPDKQQQETSMIAETISTELPMAKPPLPEEKPFILLSQDNYTEHRSAVSYARFSNGGQYVASVDVDGIIKVWTWSPESSTAATVMSKSAFLSLEWASKSDRWLLLGNRSGNIRLFDVKEMKSFYEASADASFPRIIGICSNPASPTFVCSATAGRSRAGSIATDAGPSRDHKIGKITLWDLKTMKADRSMPLEPGPVCINSCCFNHNGQLLIAGGVDGVIRLFDVNKQKCVSQWSAHTAEVRQVLFSSDYTSCYSLANDGQMCEWSMHRPGQKIRNLPLSSKVVPKFPEGASGGKEIPMGKLLALDSDGKYLLACNGSGTDIYCMMKEEPGLVPLMELKGNRSSVVTTVDWSPNIDTKICLTGYLDEKITVSTLLSQ